MRALKRWLRRARGERRLAPRRAEIRAALETYLERPCHLSSAGARGRDSIYEVSDADAVFACLRIINPHLVRAPLEADMPFRVLGSEQRLEREWSCYQRGAASGLTPRPIWRTDDALCCEYVAGERVMDTLMDEPRRFWELLCRATKSVSALHETGITHMDVSLANLIQTPAGKQVFIDFEYAPAAGLSLAQQCVYDHLRLVESCIKFMPAELLDAGDEWLQTLEQHTDARTRGCDLTPLRPALGRLLAVDALRAPLARMFRAPETAPPCS